jgi:hypothetical protein
MKDIRLACVEPRSGLRLACTALLCALVANCSGSSTPGVQGDKCQPRELSLALQPRTAYSPPIESVCVPENLPLFCWAH